MAKKTDSKSTKPASKADAPAKKGRAPRRTRMIALEPRMLFDGALGIDLGAKATAALQGDATAPAADATAPAAVPQETKSQEQAQKTLERLDLQAQVSGRTELVFVDTSVEGYQDLIVDVNPNASIVLLDSARDGIEQITEALSQHQNVDAIHIVSHGDTGRLRLGSGVLDAETMRADYAQQLAQIGRHLSADADILVYGCDFGKGEAGRDAAMRFAYLTGADIAASDDLTGHAELGGDWQLEVAFGEIESDVAIGERAQQTFRHVLATLDWDAVQAGPGWTGTSGTYSVGGANVTVTASDPGGDLAVNPGLVRDVAAGGLIANTGGLTPAEYTIGLGADFETQGSITPPSEQITLTINFAHAGGVNNVSFSIFDIDFAAGGAGWTDRLVITGNNGAVINPTSVTVGSAAGYDGTNVITGTGGSNTTENLGNATITFAQGGITQITIQYQSGRTADPAVQQINLHDISFNVDPVNTVPGPLDTLENATTPITGISVNDVDGNLSNTRVTVANGTLNVSLAGGATITSGANGTATLTLSGTAAQINAALATVNYQGNAGFTGADTLTVLSTDSNAQTDSDTVAINVVADTIVDLNSAPSVSVNNANATSDLIANGSFAGGLTSWTEGGDAADGAVGSGRYSWTGTSGGGTPTATLSQAVTVPAGSSNTTYSLTASTLTETTVETTNAVTSIGFNYGWQNTDTGGPNNNVLEVRYANVLYARLTTGGGGGTTGTWIYFNGATGTAGAGIASIANVTTTGTLVSNTITLGTPAASGNLTFTFANGPSGGGTDDIAIDNVVVTNTATTTTTATTVDRTNNDWAATYTENGTPVSIADTDSAVFDGNNPSMTGATILLTNQQTGDRLLVNGSSAGSGTLASGIGWTRTDTTVTLSGSFTKAQYADAIELVQFENTTDSPSTTQRVISVTVTDGSGTSNAAIARIDVTAVNDAPVNTVSGARSVNEDTALTFTGVDTISVNDVEGNLSTTRLTVTNGTVMVSLAGGATISSGANGSATLTLSGTQAQINAALASLSYQGNLNFNGADTLTVLSTDSNGATDSDTIAITVSSVNDGPVNTVPGAQAVNEDTALSISGVSVNDVDGNLSTTQLTVTNGILNLSLAGGATISAGANGSSTLTLSGTQAQINAALASLSYQGNLNFNGSDTLTVLSTDGNGLTDSDTVSITVNSVNDGPVNTVPGAQTVNEDTALSISGVSVNDVDGNLSTTRLTVTSGTVTVSLAGGATISAGANGSSTLTLSGTQAQINAALASLSYQGNLNFNGSDTLTVLSTDANGATDSDAVSITVSSVNDGPVNTVPGAQTVNEDTALSISGVSVNDVDGNLSTTQLTVTNGAVTVSLAGGATISAGANGSSTLTLSGTQAQINAALASLSYQGNLNFNGSDTLTVLSTDGNGATDSDAVSITVSSVNDGPVNTVPGAQTVNEDTALSISGVSVNDVDGNLSTTRLTVTNGAVTVSLAGGATISAGTNGSSTLTLSGTQAQINAALASISYQGSLNFNGSDTLTVLSTDANGATDSDAVAITVNPVNDGPVNTVPGAQTVNEDTALSISGVSVNDVDGNLSTTQLTVTNGTLNVSLAGGATISSGANGSSTLTLSGTQAQINAALGSLSYQGNLNFNGSDTLTVLSTDGNGATDSDAVAITVSSVNDGPVNTVPGAQTVNEDTVLSISGVSVNDVDGNLSTTQLTVSDGALNVSLAGGATISAGANGSSTLTLSGTQAQINAALASLSYQGNAELQRLGQPHGALDRRQRCDRLGRGLDHGHLGERRAGEHGPRRADGERRCGASLHGRQHDQRERRGRQPLHDAADRDERRGRR